MANAYDLEAAKIRNAEWRATHKEEIRLKNAAYYKAHKDEFNRACMTRARTGRYRNPVLHKVWDARRRARKLLSGGSFTKVEWLDLCIKYAKVCLCCKQMKPLEPDHVLPLALGGTSSIDNIQPLCRSCNARKGIKNTDYRILVELGLR